MRKEFERIKKWLLAYLEKNSSPDCPIIIGLSGGKDSTITAAMCKEILGAERILGVSMPDAGQTNVAAKEIVKILGIGLKTVPISKATESLLIPDSNTTVRWNLAPRIRMATLYMFANQLGGRVANTCNMSESYVGYDTRWGDQCGDFSLFQNYTATEVKKFGYFLRVPEKFVEVPPSDGLCGMTDEERWGFTYAELDRYLRGETVQGKVEDKIKEMHRKAMYKILSIDLPAVPYKPKYSKDLRE